MAVFLAQPHDDGCRVCACAALVLCAVCMHWGRPPAELRAGVRWAKLAWRFGCVGAVRRKRPAVLHCWRRRLGAGGRERGGEGGLTRVYPPGCYLFRRDGMSRQLFFELRTASFSTIASLRVRPMKRLKRPCPSGGGTQRRVRQPMPKPILPPETHNKAAICRGKYAALFALPRKMNTARLLIEARPCA